MKEVWYFLKWKWSKYTFTDKCWFIGAFFIGSATYDMYFHPEQGTPWQAVVGFGLWFTILLKWMFVDTIKEQWQRYKKEKAELLNTIKEGR